VRVGLFGGTFNPVHWGHLKTADEIRKIFDLTRVIFIPTNISPHKEPEEVVPAHHRLKMLDLVVEDNPYFFTSDVELKRHDRSYSIETITYFTQTLGKDLDLFFILGMDAFLEINTWKNYQELFSLCNFIVMTRPGYEVKGIHNGIPSQLMNDFTYMPDEKRFIHRSRLSIYFKEVTPIDISSCSIRALMKNNLSINTMLPEKVKHYIEEHKFYRD
jgi:nicotinate-nucleotide adenylyltransferase